MAVVRTDSTGGSADVWTMDLARGQMSRSTFFSEPSGDAITAALSPDGARLLVWSAQGTLNLGGLWMQPASGGGASRPVAESTTFSPNAWSSDGRYVVGSVQQAGTGYDIAYMALDDPSKVSRLATTRFHEELPALSPNGRWIAYKSDETGRPEIFVSDFPGASRKWQVSRSGGTCASWRGDGLELYYVGSSAVEAVRVQEAAGGLELDAPEPLLIRKQDLASARVGVHSPDGRRFLVLKYVGARPNEPMRLIRSWPRLLEKQK